MRILVLLPFFLQILISQSSNIVTSNPIWIQNRYFRSGQYQIISSSSPTNSRIQYNLTFSSAFTIIPSVAYAIKNYRANDRLIYQSFILRKYLISQNTLGLQVLVLANTNIYKFTASYIAIQPSFPYHLNMFQNVPLNYSSGNLVNITNNSINTFTEIIDYSQQANGKKYYNFSGFIEDYKIIIFMCGFTINSSQWDPIYFHLNYQILNQTHYLWNATSNTKILRVQLSQIVYNQKEILSSNQYLIVSQELINDKNGSFKEIPQEFVQNLIMGITDFESQYGQCRFQYQWEFQTDNSTGKYGVIVIQSLAPSNKCGFSWFRSSIFYVKTWICKFPYTYFNLSTNLCQGNGENGQLTIYSFLKNPKANQFTIQLAIVSIDPLIMPNISSYLSFNYPYESLQVTVNSQTKIITLAFTYNQSLNSNKVLIITYNSPYNVSYDISLPQTTDNNLALKIYNQNHYKIYQIMDKIIFSLSLLALICFLLFFLLVSKLIAIEMIFVFQFTYCGLIYLKKLQCLMEPYKQLWITNFYNRLYRLDDSLKLPPRISSIFYKAQFIQNFNMDFIVIFLPLIIAIILIIISKIRNNPQLEKSGLKFMKQWKLSSLLFCQFQWSYAMVLSINFGKEKVLGIFLGLFVLFLILFWVYLFIKYPESFGEYKTFFQIDLFGLNFYALVMLYRLTLSFSMILFNQSILSSILTLVINILWAILLCCKTPYNKNVRPISNSLVVILISIFYLHARILTDSQQINVTSYTPIVILILLIYTLCLSIFYFIRHYLQQKDLKKMKQSLIKIDNSNKQYNIDKRQVSQQCIGDMQQISDIFVQMDAKINEQSVKNKSAYLNAKIKRNRRHKTKKQKQSIQGEIIIQSTS